MKFYKVHSAKFKNDKVIFVPETAPFNKIPATEPIPREPSQSKSEPTEKKGIEDFEAEFGFAPIVDYFSPLEAHWREKIEAMDSFEIINVYDHGDYCEHYRYLCYEELMSRDDTMEILFSN